MKSNVKSPSPEKAEAPMTAVDRGKIAVKAMTKNLTAEHKRWNMPLLVWKNDKTISVRP